MRRAGFRFTITRLTGYLRRFDFLARRFSISRFQRRARFSARAANIVFVQSKPALIGNFAYGKYTLEKFALSANTIAI
jgi:hypothetical protein